MKIDEPGWICYGDFDDGDENGWRMLPDRWLLNHSGMMGP